MLFETTSITPFDHQFDGPVCGIDEVGRGPLAGPVTSACVMIPKDTQNEPFWTGVTDSKKLTQKKRESLFALITQNTHYAIAEASPEEIDDLNIHHATLLAMKRAFGLMMESSPPSLTLPPPGGGKKRVALRVGGLMALVDGKFTPDLPCPAQAIVKGDGLSLSIATASIIAKVTRDRMMTQLHKEYPYYGWDRNAGYGTREHLEGIKTHGITPYHRKSFAPCRQLNT